MAGTWNRKNHQNIAGIGAKSAQRETQPYKHDANERLEGSTINYSKVLCLSLDSGLEWFAIVARFLSLERESKVENEKCVAFFRNATVV